MAIDFDDNPESHGGDQDDVRPMWRQRRPWQGIPHAQRGNYGLMSILVSGLEAWQSTEIDVGVGPAGGQQTLATLAIARGDGEAMLPKPLQLADGAPLWFRASRPAVVVGVRTAALVRR